MFFIKIIASIFLLIGIISPETSWKMSEGWKFKDAEPSEVYLLYTRVISVIILIVLWVVMPN